MKHSVINTVTYLSNATIHYLVEIIITLIKLVTLQSKPFDMVTYKTFIKERDN
jgi:hypothetical protein